MNKNKDKCVSSQLQCYVAFLMLFADIVDNAELCQDQPDNWKSV